jgi:ferredoxin
MRVRLIREKCVGHARCAAVAPDVYILDDDGYLRDTDVDVPDELKSIALRGARACPERAIEVIDEVN